MYYKLTFQARRVGAVVRLFSVDHADLYITNERNQMTTELLAGMPHSLLLSNSNGEMSVLVPTVLCLLLTAYCVLLLTTHYLLYVLVLYLLLCYICTR